MPPAAPPPARTTVILGVPRSGTTWLAKIFDSHPDVLYRHEPDTVARQGSLPGFVERGEAHLYHDAARMRMRHLGGVRALKSAGSLPVFRKSFLGLGAHVSRVAMIYGLRAADLLPSARRLARRLPIPDMLHPRHAPPSHLVLKSVGSCGRACVAAGAVPEGRFVLILRNPCGQVASMMRGARAGQVRTPAAHGRVAGIQAGGTARPDRGPDGGNAGAGALRLALGAPEREGGRGPAGRPQRAHLSATRTWRPIQPGPRATCSPSRGWTGTRRRTRSSAAARDATGPVAALSATTR